MKNQGIIEVFKWDKVGALDGGVLMLHVISGNVTQLRCTFVWTGIGPGTISTCKSTLTRPRFSFFFFKHPISNNNDVDLSNGSIIGLDLGLGVGSRVRFGVSYPSFIVQALTSMDINILCRH